MANSLYAICMTHLPYPRSIVRRQPPLHHAFVTVACFSSAAVVVRPKREDHIRTKYDSYFLPWRTLIQPEVHSTGRGIKWNLSDCTSSPGVYELAIAVPCMKNQAKERCKVAVPGALSPYVGATCNPRRRLQQHACHGSHLDRFILEILCKGFGIGFRVAPMDSRMGAEELEYQLLEAYDYGWNKQNNGNCRPDDIHKKLESFTREVPQCPCFKHMGYRIMNSDPLIVDN